jgi:hypothetical protein
MNNIFEQQQTMMPNARRASLIALCLVFGQGPMARAQEALTIDSPSVDKSVRKEFGSSQGNYFGFNGPLSGQVFAGLGMPLPSRRLADGNSLLSGCRPHSCMEKAAVIVTPAGTVVAAGLIDFPCSQKRKVQGVRCERGDGKFDDPPVLTVFVTKKNDQQTVLQELKEWADGAQLADRKAYPTETEDSRDISVTEMRIISEAASSRARHAGK